MRPACDNSSLGAALGIVDEAWEELRRSPYVQARLGITPARMPDISLEEAQRHSAVGKRLLKRLDEMRCDGLPHDLMLTLRVVRSRALTWSREADWYWRVVDPVGIGFFGLFLPTAYCGGWLLNILHGQLASFRFVEAGDADRYLALLADYARLIDQFTSRTTGQAERGIRMPKVQVLQARTLLSRFRSGLRSTFNVTAHARAIARHEDLAREVENRIVASVEPAFERALNGLSDSYLAKASDSVGLGQYAGGPELYVELARFHTTLNLSPEEIHARGLVRMAEIEQQMRAIRKELRFEGDGAAFFKHLNQDARWRKDTVEGVSAVFQRYIDRLKPHFDTYFPTAPRAPYRAVPLPEALEGSMTYGYYDTPGKDHAEGRYLFNAANLTQCALFTLATLTYHELVPGHHLHFATQQENETLHPFRKHGFLNAYNEGWAEYAATLAGEIGMYEQPEERYGRLVMEAFLTSRLVVDTGMNALGWSLERARDYMRQHTGLTESEILTESVRYSCDIPGQALAYKLGDTHIMSLRDRMRRALGDHFNLKDFHAAVLGPGALPMPDLEWHVDHEIERARTQWQQSR